MHGTFCLIFLLLNYESLPAFYRMADFWSVHRDRREDGYSYLANSNMVRLHIFPNVGIAPDHLFHTCFLDEHEALYLSCKEKSVEVFVIFY